MMASGPNVRRVLITGAARGIGKAIADCYAAHRYDVIAPTRRELDLSSLDAVRAFVDSGMPEIDVLINNAADSKTGPIERLGLADWQQVLTVNLTAPLLLLQAAARGMCARKWGRIVNISSCYSIVSRAGRAPYSSSKAGINALTRTAAIEYAPQNVLVNAVCPGFVETDLTRRNNSPEQIAGLCSQVPLGRLATPEEVARYVYFLGSDENTYITGQAVIIDGGFLCQ
jgi:3-oxoacyl-[acyl-carrier protein] reductase